MPTLPDTTNFDIPDDWTFKGPGIAERFDAHVREQLPWYDHATELVAHLARSYIPHNATVYDIGASTGNIGRALAVTLEARNAKLWQVESSPEMASRLGAFDTETLHTLDVDAMTLGYVDFDLAIAFLTFSFLPVARRRELVKRLVKAANPAGAILVVDKFMVEEPRLASSLRRFTLATKLEAGVAAADVLAKELSLEGVQVPLNSNDLHAADESVRVTSVFQIAEFRGFLIERLPE